MESHMPVGGPTSPPIIANEIDALPAKTVAVTKAPASLPAQDETQVHAVQAAAHETRTTSFQDIPTSTAEDLQAFMTAHEGLGASSIARIGDALLIQVNPPGQTAGGPMIKVPTQTLVAAVANGDLHPTSHLRHSIHLFEAAHNAGLSTAVSNAILRGYRREVANGLSGQDSWLRSLTNIAVATQVEAYVKNADGLASDVSRTANFTKEAFDGSTAGGTLQALKNRTLRAETIKLAQSHLDDQLHRFTDAFAAAREDGDYAKAFDALERFFRGSAQVAETDYWRSRPTTVLNSLQSSPRPGSKAVSSLLDLGLGTVSTPAMQAKAMSVQQSQRPAEQGFFSRFSEALQAGWTWIRGRAATATAGRPQPGAAHAIALSAQADATTITGTIWPTAMAGATRPSISVPAPTMFGATYRASLSAPHQQALDAIQGLYAGISAPLTTAKARQDYAKQATDSINTLIAAGVDRNEAFAIRAQLERHYIAVINPELATVLGNTAYDMAQDPTMVGMDAIHVDQIVKRLDHRGAMAAELRKTVHRFVGAQIGRQKPKKRKTTTNTCNGNTRRPSTKHFDQEP